MRQIRYSVAVSLDGFIAGPHGENDWIVMDPEIDFEAYMARFDTILMGRRTFEAAGGRSSTGTKVVVVSRTLSPDDHPHLQIVGSDLKETIDRLKEEPGKEIWLFGGGMLFRSMLDLGLVDVIEVAVIPVLLSDGVPLLPPGRRAALKLVRHDVYKTTGTVLLEYSAR